MTSKLGPRELKNPLGFSKFEYNTVDEAKEAIDTIAQEVKMDESEAAATAFENLAVSNQNSGGAVGKFKKKDKKKPKF